MIRTLLDAWPARRRMAAVLLLPVVTTWFLILGGSPQLAPSTWWYALVLVAAVLGAGVLASYVPVAGRSLDLGCTPCASLSGLTLVAAAMALRSYGADVAGPLVAVAVLLLGLAQRMSRPATCTPAG